MTLRPADAFGRGPVRRANAASWRRFCVRHAGFFEALYSAFEKGLVAFAPIFARVGLGRLERPVAGVEQAIKSTLFDCRMCGQCVLSSTGMSCPMNCPKALRNGPCGGVRANGNCEVHPEMACVWVRAFEGASKMRGSSKLLDLQPPVDHRRAGTSSWLDVMRRHAAS